MATPQCIVDIWEAIKSGAPRFSIEADGKIRIGDHSINQDQITFGGRTKSPTHRLRLPIMSIVSSTSELSQQDGPDACLSVTADHKSVSRSLQECDSASSASTFNGAQNTMINVWARSRQGSWLACQRGALDDWQWEHRYAMSTRSGPVYRRRRCRQRRHLSVKTIRKHC